MSYSHWILAVLEDLRRYAAKNGLSDLERQLAIAGRTASEELSAEDSKTGGTEAAVDHPETEVATGGGGAA